MMRGQSVHDYYPFGWVKFLGHYEFGANAGSLFEDWDSTKGTYYTLYRVLDVRVGRWYQVEPRIDSNFVVSPYVFVRNPVLMSDPGGDFPVLSGLVGFVRGMFMGRERWHEGAGTRVGNALREAWKSEKQAWQILGGLFASDPNKSLEGRVWEVVSRFTWQLPQTVFGYLWSSSLNVVGKVRDVKYMHGATVVMGKGWWGGMTLGSFITGDRELEADVNNSLFQHEYGHYLQSQDLGLSYLPIYGLSSFLSAWLSKSSKEHMFNWTEQDANIRAKMYFDSIYGYNYTWDAERNFILCSSQIVKRNYGLYFFSTFNPFTKRLVYMTNVFPLCK